MLQNSEARLLNVRPSPGRSARAPFPMSQSRNSARRFAALSILCVRDAPHPLHRHLVAPELVCPLRFIVEPHALQIGLSTRSSCPRTTSSSRKLARTGASIGKWTHILSE